MTYLGVAADCGIWHLAESSLGNGVAVEGAGGGKGRAESAGVGSGYELFRVVGWDGHSFVRNANRVAQSRGMRYARSRVGDDEESRTSRRGVLGVGKRRTMRRRRVI